MIAIVPARGNSKAVRRKNLAVVQGKPLLCHIADTLVSAGHDVYVSTEDPEIKSIALVHGYKVIDRPKVLAGDDVTVDEVARDAVGTFSVHTEYELPYSGDRIVFDDAELYKGPFIVAQPTVPRLTVGTLHRMEHVLQEHPAVTCVTPNTHLLRKKDTMLTERWNRQKLDGVMQEVGVRMFRTPEFLGSAPSGTVVLEEWEALDIDTVDDLRAAQLRSKVISIESQGPGTGHHHRAQLLQDALQHHDVMPFTDWADLHILDVLDTNENLIADRKVRGSKVVTFEDQGSGAKHADLVINALYPHGGWDHEVSGPDWADLRPEFVGCPPYAVRPGSRILAMFGGTDPSNLGEKFTKALSSEPYEVTWVKPGDTVSVAYEMMTHDLLITSAGRTVYEAAAVGIPAVVVAQNVKEATHAHLGASNGNVYLGLGSLVADDHFRSVVSQLMNLEGLRQEFSDKARASVDGKGMQRIVHAIDGLLEGL